MRLRRALLILCLGSCLTFLNACGGGSPKEPSESEIRTAVQTAISSVTLIPSEFMVGEMPGIVESASFDEFDLVRISDYDKASGGWTAEVIVRGTARVSTMFDEQVPFEIDDRFRLFKNEFDEWEAANRIF